MRIFEARNVSKESVLGIRTKNVFERLAEEREAEKDEHDLERLRAEVLQRKS
jgi:hypothetical protein